MLLPQEPSRLLNPVAVGHGVASHVDSMYAIRQSGTDSHLQYTIICPTRDLSWLDSAMCPLPPLLLGEGWGKGRHAAGSCLLPSPYPPLPEGEGTSSGRFTWRLYPHLPLLPSRHGTAMAMTGHRRRNIKRRVAIEEAQRLQTETEGQNTHQRTFYGSWD